MRHTPPFVARSASDRTEDWPLWFVADASGLNVTAELEPSLRGFQPFISRAAAEALAARINRTDEASNGNG